MHSVPLVRALSQSGSRPLYYVRWAVLAAIAIGNVADAAELNSGFRSQEPSAERASFRPSDSRTHLGLGDSGLPEGSSYKTQPDRKRANDKIFTRFFEEESLAESSSQPTDPLGHFSPGVGGQMAEAMQAEAQRQADEESEHIGLLGERLHGRGPVRFEYIYIGEVMTNARGGRSTRNATQYLGLFNLGTDVQLEKLPLRLPGRFFLLFQHTHGQGITDNYVGDIQYVSSIDPSTNINQVSEYWWECNLLDGRVSVRLGKQDSNGEFHLIEQAAEFLHSSHGMPLSLPGPTYPHNSAGAVVLWRWDEHWTAKGGVWDGLPDGRNWGFSGTGAVFAAAEIERKYSLFDGQLDGEFDVGYAFLSQVDGDEEPLVGECHSFYLDWGQMILRENPGDKADDQGLFAFLRYGSAWPRESVVIKDFVGAGVLYKGLLPRRMDDRLGLGVNYARHNLGGTGTETALELFYKAHLTKWSTLQPDFQYVFSPSGIYRDALVVGLRYQVVF